MGADIDRVALVVAMPDELRPLVRRIGLAPSGEHVAGAAVRRGRVGPVEVVAVRTGIGPDRAAAVTSALLERERATRVVVSGIAGGIAPHTAIGDLVVPAVVVDGRTGDRFRATPIDGVTPHGTLRTGDLDAYEDGPAAFAAYAEAGVSAVDMETAAIAAQCERRGVPWLAFRAISDMAGDPGVGPDVMGLVDAEGRPRVGPALRFLVTHPRRIPRMARLGRDAARAARTAAVATLR